MSEYARAACSSSPVMLLGGPSLYTWCRGTDTELQSAASPASTPCVEQQQLKHQGPGLQQQAEGQPNVEQAKQAEAPGPVAETPVRVPAASTASSDEEELPATAEKASGPANRRLRFGAPGAWYRQHLACCEEQS